MERILRPSTHTSCSPRAPIINKVGWNVTKGSVIALYDGRSDVQDCSSQSFVWKEWTGFVNLVMIRTVYREEKRSLRSAVNGARLPSK